MKLIELFDAFAAGVYLLFGIIHLDLWRKRQDRASHLWLASAAGGALLVDLTGMRLRGTPLDGGLLPALNLFGVTIVTIALFELVISLGNGRSGLVVRGLYAGLLLIDLGIAFGRRPQLVPLLLLISMVVLIAAMVHAARAGQAGDRESRTIAGGLIVLLLCLIVDVLGALHVVVPIPGIPIVGFVVLFLVSASALNTRYEREHGELVALRGELEQRVADRTRELEAANERLAEASRTDSLTSLPNRRAFLEMSGHELLRSARSGQPCSVLMVDLDHFKQMNDRHGHAGGDALLQTAASLLRSSVRAVDLVARWGGEEFILLLPETDRAAAIGVAEKLRRALAETAFEQNGTRETITASFGVAEHPPDGTREATIAAADQALYRAKERGRNRVEA